MSRFTLHLAVALSAFGLGLFLWSLAPVEWGRSYPPPSLRIHWVSTAKLHRLHEHRFVVENVSGRAVRGYALGYEGPSGHGRYTMNPDLSPRTLGPGERRVEAMSQPDARLRIWVEYVRFSDGSRWERPEVPPAPAITADE